MTLYLQASKDDRGIFRFFFKLAWLKTGAKLTSSTIQSKYTIYLHIIVWINCISVLPHVSNKKVKFSMFSILFA